MTFEFAGLYELSEVPFTEAASRILFSYGLDRLLNRSHPGQYDQLLPIYLFGFH